MRERSRKHAFVNLSSLTAIQAANAVLPLLVYPFVLAMVGDVGFAKIVLAEALALFLLSFVLYSFEIDGVAAVVGLDPIRDNERLSRVVAEIVFVRVSFFVLGLIVLELILSILYPDLGLLVLGWSLISLSYAIQPNWLFQGLERNLGLAVCVCGSRVAAVGLVFALVRSEADYALVPFIIGGSYLAGALAAMVTAIVAFGVNARMPIWQSVRQRIWHGKEVFLGNIATGLYRDSNVLFLGMMGVPSAGIAAYSLAEKLVKAIQATMRPLNQFFFPKVLVLAQKETAPSRQALLGIFSLTWPQLAVVGMFIFAATMCYVAVTPRIPALDQIPDLNKIVNLIAVMSIAIFAGIAVFMFGIAGLNVLGARQYLLGALVFTGLLNIAANFSLVPVLGEMGSAICFVLSETILLALVIRRYFVQSVQPN